MCIKFHVYQILAHIIFCVYRIYYISNLLHIKLTAYQIYRGLLATNDRQLHSIHSSTYKKRRNKTQSTGNGGIWRGYLQK